ncbi:beta-1:4-galactosyltransferase 4-like protein [Leptotrombidium deliense]|uniref:Beta-1:4-galactosyltransferase 4-like protein n=1 Tax=Leptotrombidium deliense TaxID=299467 RepID=A0A443QKN3_9ACAR|nr:beta-1:4-galactosyltransferase 4-like protein [Leptotrombidium deliense]
MFGGACGLTETQFRKANGFSNTYIGWGSDDDDFYKRVRLSSMKIFRKTLQSIQRKLFTHIIVTNYCNVMSQRE